MIYQIRKLVKSEREHQYRVEMVILQKHKKPIYKNDVINRSSTEMRFRKNVLYEMFDSEYGKWETIPKKAYDNIIKNHIDDKRPLTTQEKIMKMRKAGIL